jgi:hypothetical protein
MKKRAVSWLVGILTAVIIAFDVYLAMDGTPNNTYSARITTWSKNHFWVAHLITAGMGLLAWHWFRDTAAGSNKKLFITALALIGSAILGGVLAEVIGFY